VEDRTTQNYDFIAVGDLVTDAFIRLKDAEVHCKIDKAACELCVRFGDKVPYESVTVCNAVGNSPNAAVCAARLGLNSALVSELGDDRIASESLSYLKSENVAHDFITKHREYKSNYHYVLWYEADRTILIKHETYPRVWPDIGSPKWLYLSSLGADTMAYQQEIARYLMNHPEIKVAFQPGTFQLRTGIRDLARIYERAEIFFCNTDEARLLLDTNEKSGANLAEMMTHHGPKMAVITDGPAGAYLYDGHLKWFMPPHPDPKPPYDRTGAGDAFTSTITACMSMGMDVHDAMLWAPINSMSVVQKIGAQAGLLTKEEIKLWLDKAPADYKLQRI
jgi:ribokinase